MVKNPPADAGDVGLTPGLGKSPGEANGNPLQSSCLGNPMDRGAWCLIPGSGRSSGEGWQPTPVFLPGNFHGKRSWVGYSPWGHTESDTT